MRDEEYRPEQIPSYGTHEQLALAERMRPLLRTTQIGNGFALLAVLAAVAAVCDLSDQSLRRGQRARLGDRRAGLQRGAARRSVPSSTCAGSARWRSGATRARPMCAS